QYAAGRALLQLGKTEAAKAHFSQHADLMERLFHNTSKVEGGMGGKDWIRWAEPPEVDVEPTEAERKPGLVAPGRFRFVDVAREAGFQLRNVSGGLRKDYIVESLGGGACWLDYDNDGRLDFFLPNGLPMSPTTGNPPHDALYRNRGDGTFQE